MATPLTGIDLNSLFSFLSYGLFFVFILYGQRIQFYTTLISIIMVDAASKLEGEKTGEVAEGVGAAIGGTGVDKFQIEEVASKHKIPVYAVLVKEGELDVMATMKKEIKDAVQRSVGIVRRIIEERTKEGDKVLLAGIGNTLGIGQ